MTSQRKLRTLAARPPILLALVAVAAGCSSSPGAPDAPSARTATAESTPAAPTRTYEGRLRAYVVDSKDGTSRTGYALERGPGDFIDLQPAPELPALTNTQVAITGMEVGAGAPRIEVASIASREPAASRAARAFPSAAAVTTAHVAIVLLDFAGVAPQSLTVADVEKSVANVHAYYQEISYGHWDFEADVYGPYTVPLPADCNLPTVDPLARSAAAADGHTIPAGVPIGVALPTTTNLGCACGLAWVGNSPATPNPSIQTTALWSGCADDNGIAHEFGHNFGWLHASKAHCNGVAMKRDVYNACDVEEYGNHFNTMGNGLGHPNGFQKSNMAWLTGCGVVRVSSDQTFDLVPIQRSSADVQTLQIPTGDTNGGVPTYYYVEYRNTAGATFNAADNGVLRELGPGLHVSVARDFATTSGDGRSLVLDLSAGALSDPGYVDPRLTPGRSFVDPDGRVAVTFLSASADTARVQVSFPGGGSGANVCIDGALPSPIDPAKGVVALYQDCNFGGSWRAALPVGDYTTAQLVAAGAKDKDASSIWVAPGYEAILFDGPGFTGASQTLTASDTCLLDRSFNDVLSSIQVRAVAVPDAGLRDDGGLAEEAGVAEGGGASVDGAAVLAALDGGGGAVDGDTLSAGVGCDASGRAAGGSWPWLFGVAGAVLARRRRSSRRFSAR